MVFSDWYTQVFAFLFFLQLCEQIPANLNLALHLFSSVWINITCILSGSCTDSRCLWDEWVKSYETMDDSCMQIEDRSLCVIMCKLPTKQTRQEESRVLELSFWSSLSVLWLNELWWEGWGGGFELFMLLKRQIWTVVGTLEARQHPPHIISGYCQAVSGGSVYREGTGTRFSSIMHDNKSQRPTVYCGEPLRLWPKWFGHEENFPVHAGPNLKNTAW